jgi:hypothetical protein
MGKITYRNPGELDVLIRWAMDNKIQFIAANGLFLYEGHNDRFEYLLAFLH